MNTLLEQEERKQVDSFEFRSELLQRTVRMDLYQAGETNAFNEHSLLLVNDAGRFAEMDLESILQSYDGTTLMPLTIVAIHRGEDSENEYGMSSGPDFRGLGSRAAWYEQFVISELIPFVGNRLHLNAFRDIAFAGFGQGALSAFDITWNNPDIFSRIGVFSGHLGWRSMAPEEKSYDRSLHRLLHNQVRNSSYHPGMKFFFQCNVGNAKEDLNKNGVADSIDDTLDLIRELIRKGYQEGKNIHYLQQAHKKAVNPALAEAFSLFLKWGWGYEL